MENTPFFVHPGCLKKTDCNIPSTDRGKESIYGDYDSYLERLLAFHRGNNKPAVFLLYFSGEKPDKCHDGFDSKWGDIVLEYLLGSANVLKVRLGKEEHVLSPEETVEFLRGNGVKSVDLVGEWGPYRRSYQGCVGWTWELLQPSFNVKGLPGLVYPTKPFTYSISPEARREFARTPAMSDELVAERVKMFRGLYPHQQF